MGAEDSVGVDLPLEANNMQMIAAANSAAATSLAGVRHSATVKPDALAAAGDLASAASSAESSR